MKRQSKWEGVDDLESAVVGEEVRRLRLKEDEKPSRARARELAETEAAEIEREYEQQFRTAAAGKPHHTRCSCRTCVDWYRRQTGASS